MMSWNPVLFGDTGKYINNQDKTNCLIVNMLLSGALTFEGKLSINRLDSIKKRHIWSYLYYLWTHNRTIQEFQDVPTPENMKNLVVPNELYVTKSALASVINRIVEQNKTIDVSVLSKLLFEIEQKVKNEDATLQISLSKKLPELEAKIRWLEEQLQTINIS